MALYDESDDIRKKVVEILTDKVVESIKEFPGDAAAKTEIAEGVAENLNAHHFKK